MTRRRYIVFLGDAGTPNEEELAPPLEDLEDARRAARDRSMAASAFVWDRGLMSVVAQFKDRVEEGA
jgi:hypothetical protein